MRDSDIGEVGVDSLYNLIIVVSQLLKLEVKVVQPRDELYFRRVAFDNNKLLGEEPFDDKSAALCSSPASASIRLKRIFSSVVSLKLYRWMRGAVAVGRPVLFLAVVIVFGS